MAKLKDKGFFANQPEPDLDESRYRHTAGKQNTTYAHDASTSKNLQQKEVDATSSAISPSVGRPRNSDIIRSPGARHGVRRGYTRFSVVADENLLQWYRDYAYTERMSMREAIEAALHMYKDAQEEAGITIIPNPKRRIIKE